MKRNLRLAAEETRKQVSKKAAKEAGFLLSQLFFSRWSPEPGCVISGFWPFRSEIDLKPLLHALHGKGYIVALPEVVAARKPLLFRHWTPVTPLKKDFYGVLALPKTATPVKPDWLLVPLLAFDMEGYRLGYGGGYYDVTLSQVSIDKQIYSIGVAYDQQEVDRVPREKKDYQLDAILTETRTITIEA